MKIEWTHLVRHLTSSSAAWLEVPITQSVRYSTILFLRHTNTHLSDQFSQCSTWTDNPTALSFSRARSFSYLNFISWQKDRSSLRFIITSTSWHSLVLICMAWIALPRIRTYLPAQSRQTTDHAEWIVLYSTSHTWRCGGLTWPGWASWSRCWPGPDVQSYLLCGCLTGSSL